MENYQTLDDTKSGRNFLHRNKSLAETLLFSNLFSLPLLTTKNYSDFQPETIAQTSGKWKLTAFLYEKIWRLHALSILTFGKFNLIKEKEWIQKFVKVENSEQIVLDLTCANGLYGRWILQNGSNLTVIFHDFSLEMLKSVAKKISRERLNNSSAVLLQSWAVDTGLTKDSVDIVLCGGSWNELTKTQLIVNHIFHILKPGGKTGWMGILKSETKIGRFIQSVATKLGGLHFESESEVIKTFSDAGFKNVRVTKVGLIFLLETEK